MSHLLGKSGSTNDREEEDKRRKKLTCRLRAKRIAVVRTEVIHLDHDLIGARTVRRQSIADAALTGCTGARAAAVDGLGDGGVVAAATVPAAGDAVPPAAAVLGEGGD